MKYEDLYSQHTHIYFSLRRAVGWIGMLLPFTLMLGNYLYFKGKIILPSISQYYHSPMRDVFVGALCSIASFMFFYSGLGKWDRYAGVLAGIFTLGVVFFPTSLENPHGLIGTLHSVFAALLFLHLAAISLFYFPRKREGRRKRVTDRIQAICGVMMLFCVIATFLFYNYINFGQPQSPFVFVTESIALIAFGVAWFTEGLDLEIEII
jgi:hypothetical protein